LPSEVTGDFPDKRNPEGWWMVCVCVCGEGVVDGVVKGEGGENKKGQA